MRYLVQFPGMVLFTIVVFVDASAGVPNRGILPNEECAVRVAEAILQNVYGKDVLNERPFLAKLNDGKWIIDGSFHCSEVACKGGVAHLELDQRDARVLNIIHGK